MNFGVTSVITHCRSPKSSRGCKGYTDNLFFENVANVENVAVVLGLEEFVWVVYPLYNYQKG